MKKSILVFVMLFLVSNIMGQRKIRYGLELNTNLAFVDTYQRSTLYSLNAFVVYEQYEMYLGFDISDINYLKKRIWGYEAGLKYHIYESNRKSNFYIDLNYQYSHYCEGCIGAVNHKYDPEPMDACEKMYQLKTWLLTSGLGYELFYRGWISSALSIGPGLNWTRQYPLSQPGPLSGPTPRTSERHLSFIGLIKASIRFTF